MKVLLLTEKFKDLVDKDETYIFNNKLSMGLLLDRLSNYQLVNYSIVIGEIEKLFNEQYKREIENILYHRTPLLYCPKGMLSSSLVYHFGISEIESFDHQQTALAISEEFFYIHRIQCLLDTQIATILFHIISRPKYLIKYLELFIIKHTLWSKIGYYTSEDKVFSSIEDGVKFLESQLWIIDQDQLSNLINQYKEDTQQEQETKVINNCSCQYVSYKQINNEFHFQIEEQMTKYTIEQRKIPKRELHLSLKKEVEISNSMEFYKQYILKSVSRRKLAKTLKTPKLQVKKLTNELHFKY